MQLSIGAAADEAPRRVALVTDTATDTFRDLADAAGDRLERLRSAVGTEDLAGLPIALVGRLDRDTYVTALAALEVRARLVLLHPRAPTAARQEQALHTGCAAIVDGPRVEMVRGPPRHPDADWAVLVFTSGSEGAPRAVRLTRSNLAAAADASAANLGWRDDDRWLLALPLSHVGGLSVLTRTLAARRTAVVSEVAPAEAITRHRVTLASFVPTQLRRLITAHDEGARPHSLRACLLGGAAAPPALVRAARERGFPVLLTWGMSEAASQIATQSPDLALSLAARDLQTVGRPLPSFEVRLVDDRAHVRSPCVTPGYLPMPTGDGAIVAPPPADPDAEGWLATGDRVEWLDGALRVLGREGGMVIVGGENVSPTAVEAHLSEFPAVADTAVVGIPHPEWDQAVAAAVVWRGVPDIEGLAAWCRSTLPPWERPVSVRTVRALPVGPTGKVDRAGVRGLFA